MGSNFSWGNKLSCFQLVFVASLLLGASISSGDVAAIPEYSKDLPSSLKNNCKVCHERASGGPVNSFGRDYSRLASDLEVLSGLDSDDDSYTNGEELAAGSLPGDPNSTPLNKRKGVNIMYILAAISILLILGGLYIRMKSG